MQNPIFEKYPLGSNRSPLDAMDNGLPNASAMPRALRETKNNQLFEKYMNRHTNQQKNKMDMQGSPNTGGVGVSGMNQSSAIGNMD